MAIVMKCADFFKNSNHLMEYIFYGFICIPIIIVSLYGLFVLDIFRDVNKTTGRTSYANLERSIQILDDDEALPRNKSCTFWDCLDLYRCGHDRLTVFVYPLHDYVEMSSGEHATTFTREYYQILEAVIRSPYYTSNPNEACLFLLSIDLLNQKLIKPNLVTRALATLDHWENGGNHILFNMLPGIYPTFQRVIEVNTDHAIILGGGFDVASYRSGFDLSIPVYSPALEGFESTKLISASNRKYKLIIAQLNMLPKYINILNALSSNNYPNILMLSECVLKTPEENLRCDKHTPSRYFQYPRILLKGTFCLLSKGYRLGQADLLEMLAYNCIPVIAIDNYILPFEEVLDWTLASLRIRESDLPLLMDTLNAISNVKILELRKQGKKLYNNYFSDLKTIATTSLKILEGRIFPHRAQSFHQWNFFESYHSVFNPLFLQTIAPKSQGFTAIILTFDRVESLYLIIQKLSVVPSLQSILVVWNNQRKSPPFLSSYPMTSKPLKVIRTRANKLSNRFYPYPEIETEAILTIDDDILMLTADELDFGFEVWREFPDRIVGFPSRVHVWNNDTMAWHYESEWTNQISMVLTGAAFHHKFWSHMYSYAMPGDIKEWVDEHMNCEDIAMNFLIANITKKPPIKVTPRKKFKCPECTNTEMLSADLDHMRERSACVDHFARIYGRMPLRSVEFRADPVLFKDNFPEKLKRFNDVGNL